MIIIFGKVFSILAMVGVGFLLCWRKKYGRNSKLMAEGVTLTTILSLVTIPIAASLLTAYYC